MKRFIPLFLMMLITLVIYTPAYAASFVVSTEAEFRAAIAQANDEVAHPGADTILLAGDITFLKAPIPQPEFTITSQITIDGQGFKLVCDNADPPSTTSPIVQVNSNANLTLTNLVMQGLVEPPSSEEWTVYPCAGIDNDGTISILNSDISYFYSHSGAVLENTATGVALIDNSQIHHITSFGYGALFNDGGILSVNNSSFSHNIGQESTSILQQYSGVVNFTDTTFEDNLNGLIGIYAGEATFTRCHFLNNPGGIWAHSWDFGASQPTLTIIDSEFIGNTGQLAQGVFVTIEGSSFENNTDDIALVGIVKGSIKDTSFVGNTITPGSGYHGTVAGTGNDIYPIEDGLIIENSIFQNNTVQRGGVVGNYNGNLTVKDTLITGNYSEGGSAIYLGTFDDINPIPDALSHLTVIDTEIANNVDTNASNGITSAIEAADASSITLLRTNVSNNSGGINTLGTTDPVEISVMESTFAGNHGHGAIQTNYATVNIADSTFSENLTVPGPGVWLVGNIQITRSSFINHIGGALYVSGTTQITESRFVDNQLIALTTGEGSTLVSKSLFTGGVGHAIYTYGSTEVVNTTISGNVGFGIYRESGDVIIRHSSFINNDVLGIVNGESSTPVQVFDSIFTANEIGDCSGNVTVVNTFSDDGTCGATAVTGVNLTLADNGGNTLTHALLPGSNAINSGGNCNAAPVDGVDQRGFYRDAQCDAGAFEYMGQDITATPTATATFTATATATFTATQTASQTPSATVELPTETPSDTPTETATPDGTATIESSPTDIPSAIATDVPSSTPTNIPTATATTQIATELLINGDFESDLTGWTQKNATNDKVKCNKPGKPIAFEGECAYQFKGSVGENSKLQQTVASSGINANDTLTFNGYAYPKGSDVNTSIKVTVKYADANLEKGKIVIKLNTAAADYQLQTGSLALIATPSQIKVQVSNKGTSGKVLFDALSLTQTTTIARLIPLPRP